MVWQVDRNSIVLYGGWVRADCLVSGMSHGPYYCASCTAPVEIRGLMQGAFFYVKINMQGWIKLHRKLLENPIMKRPSYAWLWITLLLKANHKEKKFMWNKEIIMIKEGQLITGRKELSVCTGIAETTIEDILNFLEKSSQIRQQKTTKFRLITVINWKDYQESDNKPTTNRQQTDTNKNVNNEKKQKARVLISSLKDKKGNPIDVVVGSDYEADGWSPKQRLDLKRKIERSLGVGRSNRWTQLLCGSAWDFKKGFAHFQGYEYPDTILLDEVSKTLAKWYELGETRDSIRDMMTAFFKGKKAGAVTITPNSVFSSHTYNSWKQNKL